MMPSAAELNYFLEVAHTLNLSRAAERLGISQPALTIAIRRLEDSLGQPVLLRGKTGVRLTRAGEKLTIQARALLQEWEKITADASKDASEIRGRFTLGCHPSVALYTLPFVMPRLLTEYPDLEIQLTHDLSRKITEDVISFKIDFGIVVNPTPHPDLVIIPLINDEVTLWVNEEGGGKQALSGVLIYDPALVQIQQILRKLDQKKLGIKRTITSGNLEVITALVGCGVGIGILPGRVAGRIKTPKLVELPGSWPIFKDKICLVYRADAQKSKAGQIISKQIVSILRSQ
jgi:LysR family transcriptional regulator, cell division regulator